MKEVLPGIYQMPLTLSGFSPDTVNTYLVRDGSSYTMVDTGWDSPPALESIENQLSEIGAHLSDVKRAIATHCHTDHFGLFPRLKNDYKAQVCIHKNELDLIRTRFTGGDNYLLFTDNFLKSHGVPPEELPPPEFTIPVPQNLAEIKPDVLLEGGEEIKIGNYVFKVINTPGHTPGHISLYETRKKFLFSGDVLLPTIVTNAAMHVQHIQFPIQQYLNSLLSLKSLKIEQVLPGHENIFTNHKKRIDEIIKQYQDKTEVVRTVFINGNDKTAYEVAGEVYHRQTRDTWNKMTGWDKRFAILQTIARLESLRYDHMIDRECKHGIFYYLRIPGSFK
jgi:glyoxylase-like metal-dependent hydrolase (beta-lactamase superfamily II)